MLDRPPPLEQTPPVNVLFTTYTGSLLYWLSARIAAPPRSGPLESQRLSVNLRIDDGEPATPVEDRAAAAALECLAGRVALGERDVLDGQPWRRLVVAVRRRPHLGLVAGVHVEDAALAAAAQRDLARRRRSRRASRGRCGPSPSPSW